MGLASLKGWYWSIEHLENRSHPSQLRTVAWSLLSPEKKDFRTDIYWNSANSGGFSFNFFFQSITFFRNRWRFVLTSKCWSYELRVQDISIGAQLQIYKNISNKSLMANIGKYILLLVTISSWEIYRMNEGTFSLFFFGKRGSRYWRLGSMSFSIWRFPEMGGNPKSSI